ncbi:hypothetical protein [Morchella esculenta fusarivirus 1]|uniref:Uncharacterized protein n=1 Tax=Morchella esculenta fusarivirus 1 TaxID=2830906 RepID=A0AAE7RAW5_9VIRU|nr:hypothetical protein [Morchella esculenta fusarivirus 1]
MRYASEDLSIFVTPMFIHREVSFGVAGDYSPAKKYIANFILGNNRLLDGAMNNAIIDGNTPLRDEIGSFDFIEVCDIAYKASTGRIQSLSNYLPLFRGPQCISGPFSGMEELHLVTDLLALRTAIASLPYDATDETAAISKLTDFVYNLGRSEPKSEGYFYKEFRGRRAYQEIVGFFLRTIAYFDIATLVNFDKIKSMWDVIAGAAAYDPKTRHTPEPVSEDKFRVKATYTAGTSKRRPKAIGPSDTLTWQQPVGDSFITFKYNGLETWENITIPSHEAPEIIPLDKVKKVAPDRVGRRKPSDISETARLQTELERSRKLRSFREHYTGVEDDFDRGLDYE